MSQETNEEAPLWRTFLGLIALMGAFAIALTTCLWILMWFGVIPFEQVLPLTPPSSRPSCDEAAFFS